MFFKNSSIQVVVYLIQLWIIKLEIQYLFQVFRLLFQVKGQLYPDSLHLKPQQTNNIVNDIMFTPIDVFRVHTFINFSKVGNNSMIHGMHTSA